MAKFNSNLGKMMYAQQEVAKAALEASCIVLQNQARENVRGGFKSGDFVTGNLMRSIAHDVVHVGKDLRGFVGTPVDYGAFWEFGHHNAWTRQYERVPWLEPATRQSLPAQREAAHLAARIKARQIGLELGVLGLRFL